MNRFFKPLRIAILIIIPLSLSAACVLALYGLQIVNGAAYYEESQNNIVTTETVAASRGKILDRYGRVLVSNRISYNVVINRAELVSSPEPNDVLLRLVNYTKRQGIEYRDTCPISPNYPYDYRSELDNSQRENLEDYLNHFSLEPEISAAELIVFLRKHYNIPEEYSAEQARTAMGIRYELELRTLFGLPTYYYAQDIDISLISIIEEQNFPGVSIATSSVREYNTSYAAHILGRVGPMNAEEYEIYRELDYPMNAQVGKDGLEEAFESYLRGTDGERATSRNAAGAITSVLYTRDPLPGNNVVTTLDIECQQVAEEALASTIEIINAEKAEGVAKADSGAVVVLEIKTGDVLACASHPSFNLDTLLDDYMDLLEDPSKPLLNRATQGLYEPGSTFKPVTAMTFLNEGIINVNTEEYDKGIYTEYTLYAPTCWIYPGSHGSINVKQAIEVSCNYFFYNFAPSMTIETLSHYAEMFGLGQKTGVEIYEEYGMIPSRDLKEEEEGIPWYVGDTIQAAIGQSYNRYTPMQIASYCSTIANSGVRYAAHFLKNVKTHDDSGIIYEYSPVVLNVVNAEKNYFSAIQEGMLGASISTDGTAYGVFGAYEIDVASKTGTVQLGENLENNAVFIAYAPFDDPEIAVAVVVEKGGAGSAVTEIARSIFDYYFSIKNTQSGTAAENTLLR